MSRRVRHVYARDDEYIAVHRPRRSSGGVESSDSTTAENAFLCVFMITVTAIICFSIVSC